MADLSVKRLGLVNPFVIAASPATHGVDAVLKSAGVRPGAVVMRNLRHGRGGGNLFIPSAGAVLEGGDAAQIHACGGMTGDDWFGSSEEYFQGVARARRSMPDEVKLWVSIGAMWETVSHPSWEKEWLRQALAAEEAGADAVELHFNTPGAAATRGRIFDLERWILAATKHIKKHVEIPVMVKLPVENVDALRMIEAAAAGGADAAGPTARWRGLVFDLDLESSPASTPGGYSGTQVLPIICYIVAEARLAGIMTPMFAGGGVFNWQAALKLVMAGSDAVQLGSVACGIGPKAVRRMISDVTGWMDENGYPDIESLCGSALELMRGGYAEKKRRCLMYGEIYKNAAVDADKCTNCGMCEDACWFGAIDRSGGEVKKTEKCIGCGYCFQVCPTGALSA